ncbi:MAG TPA: DUF971 domain-containing protein [Candidatus Saccharimonadales bacterium]|nr:DUF971 domain-containing protein [Candidatus Saccharimonadales bacterium]
MTTPSDPAMRSPGSGPADGPGSAAGQVAAPSGPGATTPTAIHADREAGTLALTWADGHATTFDALTLRWLCPCAYCRGEAGMPGWLDSAPTLTPDQTRLVDLHLVGNYAISPHWADGHKTGYYPFVLLRDRCPCAACSARRDAAVPPVAGAGTAGRPAAGSHEEHR